LGYLAHAVTRSFSKASCPSFSNNIKGTSCLICHCPSCHQWEQQSYEDHVDDSLTYLNLTALRAGFSESFGFPTMCIEWWSTKHCVGPRVCLQVPIESHKEFFQWRLIIVSKLDINETFSEMSVLVCWFHLISVITNRCMISAVFIPQGCVVNTDKVGSSA